MADATRARSIWIDAEVGRLADVRAFVREHAARAGADDETTADLVQAVDELVCNVIQHGYAGDQGRIEVVASQSDDELAFAIRDDAPLFDPTTVPEPPVDLPLDRRPLGGMGVHLARDLTDRFDHRMLPRGGNEVTVAKRLRTVTGGLGDGHHDRPAEG